MGKLFLFCLAGVLVLNCTSCKSRTAYQDERTERALVEHFRAKNQELTDGKALTLQDCIAASMTNTLFLRFRAAAEDLSDPQAAVEILKMLPSFRFRDGLPGRSDAPSMTIRRPNYYNVDVMIGLLDFGLGYWYSQEYLYEKAFREQLMRKTAGRIQYETAKAYYRAGALQSARFQLEMQLEKLRNQTKTWQKAKDPVFAAALLRKYGELELRLHETEEEHNNACTRLRTLMGLYPIPDVNLDGSVKKEPGKLTLPRLSIMEQIALSRRPELYMGDIRKKVSLPACRGLITQLFPELQEKDFCSPAGYCQLSSRALYDLLQTPDRFAGKGRKERERIISIHSYAGALAVMAQVRMAYNEYVTAMDLYKKAKAAQADCKKLLQKGRAGTLEYADMFLDTLQADLQKEKAAMRCRIAESRILYAMGISKLDDRLVDTVMEELSDAAKAAAEDLKKARQQHSEREVAMLSAELKKLQKEEAERKLREEEKIRKETNEEIDKSYGSARNPAFWEELGK